MSKVFDVDKHLSDNAITIRIKGKDFEVKDVPEEVTEKFNSEDKEERKDGLCLLLGCTKKDLEGYGHAATSAIISNIMENLFPKSSLSDRSEG